MISNFSQELKKTDPEFTNLFDNFALEEVASEHSLDNKSRFIAILATLIGCEGVDEYKVMLPIALDNGVTPIEVKEIVYQGTAYLGIGRVYPFLIKTNEILLERGVNLPLETQGTTNIENRREKGTDLQVDIFGEGMKDFWKGGHINKWLASNCFGDYYSREGLDLKQREMITFCFISAQGGCEAQLKSHIAGNINIGNDKDFLIKVVSQCIPYIGYPRSLNAINCINEVVKERKR